MGWVGVWKLGMGCVFWLVCNGFFWGWWVNLVWLWGEFVMRFWVWFDCFVIDCI